MVDLHLSELQVPSPLDWVMTVQLVCVAKGVHFLNI